MKKLLLILVSSASALNMNAEPISEFVTWAKDPFTNIMVNEGVSALGKDAKALAAASWKLAQDGYKMLPSKEVLLKSVKDGGNKSYAAARSFITSNPRATIFTAVGAAFAAPLIAGLIASFYDEKKRTAEENELRSLQVIIYGIKDYLNKFPDESTNPLDPEITRFNNEIMLRAFYDTLKYASEELNNCSQCFVNLNLKSQIDNVIKIINNDMTVIGLENKEFEKAFIDLKAAMKVLNDWVSTSSRGYVSWFSSFIKHVNNVEHYLNALRSPVQGEKVPSVESIQEDVRKREAYETLDWINRVQFVSIHPELIEAFNHLKQIVCEDITNVTVNNAELKRLLYGLEQSAFTRLQKIDKSIAVSVAFGAIPTISFPLIAFAKIVEGFDHQ